MRQEDLKAIFDKQASGYDKQWEKHAPILNGLYYLLKLGLAELPEEARILCVGPGTGREMAYLAEAYPAWQFTAVEPSGGMLEVCRRRAEEQGFASRCYFHEGYLDSLPPKDMHHAATCFLVSQFILEPKARSAFFQAIADRLVPGGILANADLASDISSNQYDALLRIWIRVQTGGHFSAEKLEQTRATYAGDVAVLPPESVAAMIEAGGFQTPVEFFRAALVHGWFAKRV